MANWKKAKETVLELRGIKSFDTQRVADDLLKAMKCAEVLADEEASDDYYVHYVGTDIHRKLEEICILIHQVFEARLDLFTYIYSGASPVKDDDEEENGI